MSLIIASHDSLPYIEPTPTATELSTIASLIAAELPTDHATAPHPSLLLLLPAPRAPTFTPVLRAELERVARGEPLVGGIDLSRYEPPSAPRRRRRRDDDDDDNDDDDDDAATAWDPVLRSAYASSVHLSARLTNLSLLSEFGKNAWLIHNSQLEDLLRRLEEELMALKTDCEVTNKERKAAQKDVEDELKRYEDRWRKGVGRVLEVELASEGLRRDILEKQRAR